MNYPATFVEVELHLHPEDHIHMLVAQGSCYDVIACWTHFGHNWWQDDRQLRVLDRYFFHKLPCNKDPHIVEVVVLVSEDSDLAWLIVVMPSVEAVRPHVRGR